MPFQLPPVAELEKEFVINEVPGIPAIHEDNTIVVVFRQATEDEDAKREAFINVPVRTSYDTQGVFEGETRQPKTVAERRTKEVHLTMSACDILGEDGKPLFAFAEVDGKRRLTGTFSDFKKKWGLLPKPITVALHDRCIEANPDWGFRWLTDEDLEGEG